MAADFAFSDYTPKMIFSYRSETEIIHFLTPECHTNKMIPRMFRPFWWARHPHIRRRDDSADWQLPCQSLTQPAFSSVVKLISWVIPSLAAHQYVCAQTSVSVAKTCPWLIPDLVLYTFIIFLFSIIRSNRCQAPFLQNMSDHLWRVLVVLKCFIYFRAISKPSGITASIDCICDCMCFS